MHIKPILGDRAVEANRGSEEGIACSLCRAGILAHASRSTTHSTRNWRRPSKSGARSIAGFRRRWSSASGVVNPSRRTCSTGANTTSGATRSSRATPAFLPPPPPGAPLNRLGLAQWLVAPNHPLTARVAINRFWLQVFGTGLVKTAEDFGSQGEPPSHPELLDWLAVQFREDGWDVKRFMKRLVMSATYRQSSRVTPESLAKDPANRLLSRGPRYRLDAETIRDQALYVAGLLVEQVGGPSVKPPQPAGLMGGGRLYRQQHRAVHGRQRGPRRFIAAACTSSGSGPRRRPR